MIKERDKGKREKDTHKKNTVYDVINVIIEVYKRLT